VYIIDVMIINNKNKGEKIMAFINDILDLHCPILNFNIFVGAPIGIVWFALITLGVIG
tara:strand:+ start:509 stop:682 length:174 start_codon:yes stop_codon:yes gene_type:complete